MIVGPVTDHEFRLTVQTPFSSLNENDLTNGFGNYMNTESLSVAGGESIAQQDVTISANSFSADLTSTVTASGSIAATTAELRFGLDVPATISFSGSATGRNGISSGFNIALRSRTENELLLFADGGTNSSINWSTLGSLMLPSGLYEFKAISSVSNGQIGTHFNNIVASFTSNGMGTAGDFDMDSDIDGSDLLAWQRNPAIGSLSDWQGNYGNNASLSAAISSVPEPATGLLAGFALVFLSARRQWLVA